MYLSYSHGTIGASDGDAVLCPGATVPRQIGAVRLPQIVGGRVEGVVFLVRESLRVTAGVDVVVPAEIAREDPGAAVREVGVDGQRGQKAFIDPGGRGIIKRRCTRFLSVMDRFSFYSPKEAMNLSSCFCADFSLFSKKEARSAFPLFSWETRPL